MPGAACVPAAQPADRRLACSFCPLPLQLVLINISDHHTRTRANAPAGSKEGIRVLGCLLGQQAGRVVDISNSFEMRYRQGSSDIDEPFLQKKMEQCEWEEGGWRLRDWLRLLQAPRAARGPATGPPGPPACLPESSPRPALPSSPCCCPQTSRPSRSRMWWGGTRPVPTLATPTCPSSAR